MVGGVWIETKLSQPGHFPGVAMVTNCRDIDK